jgi:ABC-type branched-subunit amino acid transport system substrate-binding protein
MANLSESPRPRGAFPPAFGWIPILVGLATVTVASVVAFVPQYATRQIASVTQNPGGGGLGAPVAGATPIPGTQGHTVPGSDQGQGGSKNDAGHSTGSGGGCQAQYQTATDIGVSAHRIDIATTDVTTGVGSSFLGEAVEGMKAAIARVNQSGGICGRTVVLHSVNDGWSGPQGADDISKFIGGNNIFALVGEPDSEGLNAAETAGTIDRAGIPVVGTDGMLAAQYSDPWIWPVAASTVTNMHIAAQYAVKALHASHVGIVYDNRYKFGLEGAGAFKAEIQRLSGSSLRMGDDCSSAFCGIDPDATDYSSSVQLFNGACGTANGAKPCDLVVMLLEPLPMQNWMKDESSGGSTWYHTLMGGEPLFDDNLASNCGQACASMIVWTGYKPDIPPFDGATPVYTYAHDLRLECPSCDPHNEFSEGAYLGTQLFIAACEKVGSNLTRTALRQVLDSATFDLGLSGPLRYGTSLPHLANTQMAAFSANTSGTFNGWNYLSTGFVTDPHPGQDMSAQ